MAEKGKARGVSAKSRPDKSRTSGRAQGRQAKKHSPRTPRHTSAQPSPSPDEAKEPLDIGPILNELLDRVLSECALAAAVRQRVPFTVSRARDAILFVAEWRFPARDEGDPDREGDPDPERDGIWSEDEEPQTCPWDSWVPAFVPLDDVSSRSSEESSDEDLPATAEDEGPFVCPEEVPDAVPVLAVPLPPGQVPAAAAAASPAQVLGADIAPMPGPPCPEPPMAPQPPERGRRLSRDPGRGGIPAQPPERGHRLSRDPGRGGISTQPPERGHRLSRDSGRGGIPAQRPERGHRLSRDSGRGGIPAQPPEKGSQPSRPPQPRPAPLDAPRPRAPLPAEPSEPPAQAPQVPREGTAKVGHQVPPLPPSSPSPAPIQPRRPSRVTGVPRLGGRRLAPRWVVPEVKVVDVSNEPEWARPGAPRPRLVPSWAPQVVPGAGRARKVEPQLCDPWLASARLAPGVTVRWGRSERRGPALPGRVVHGQDEQDDEAVSRAEKELKPILPYPECRISEYDE